MQPDKSSFHHKKYSRIIRIKSPYIKKMKSTLHVCLIEDDQVQVFLLKKFLEKIAHVGKVQSFGNGKIAYETLKESLEKNESLPDLIFLDINMPEWSGWDFLEAYTKLPSSSSTDIFILSSSLSPDDFALAEENGLKDRFLSKPVGMEDIREVINGL